MPSANFYVRKFDEPDVQAFNYCERNSWYLKEIVIYAHHKVTILGTTTVSVYYIDSLVNEQCLGNDHVGVVFTLLVCCFDFEIRQKKLPLYYPGLPFLVRWPLLLLKQVGVVEFLGELVTKAYKKAQAEEVSPTLLLEKKCASNFNKREKADHMAKRRKKLLSKRIGKLSDKSVDKALVKQCCPKNSCKTMSFHVMLNTK
jgi:hypothetical protein